MKELLDICIGYGLIRQIGELYELDPIFKSKLVEVIGSLPQSTGLYMMYARPNPAGYFMLYSIPHVWESIVRQTGYEIPNERRKEILEILLLASFYS